MIYDKEIDGMVYSTELDAWVDKQEFKEANEEYNQEMKDYYNSYLEDQIETYLEGE